MTEKHIIWDETSGGLILSGAQKAEDEQIKSHKKQSNFVHDSKIYCPHTYLILNFHETLNQSEKITFRKYYLRKVFPNEPNVIILQDIKNLVIFLLATPVSPQFMNFFHLPIVDRFLRALIIYFQFYVKIWEELMAERAATMKKAPNPLARGHRSRYANEMYCLRCMLGREYADLVAGCQDDSQYHHMTAGKKGTSSMTQSQGEKDLRIFEVLICMAHRVVWIALQRKYFNLIGKVSRKKLQVVENLRCIKKIYVHKEVELHRLLRSEAYNTAERRSNTYMDQEMLKDDIRVLHGQKVQVKRKLLRHSPLIQELVYSDCDYRVLSLGIENNDTHDPRILYLQNALLIEEDKLSEVGIKVGILGESRANYDVMLMPCEDEKAEKSSDVQLSERVKYEKRTSSEVHTTSLDKREEKIVSLPPFETEHKLAEVFPIKIINVSPRGYKTAREEARRKWIIREIKRHNRKQKDEY